MKNVNFSNVVLFDLGRWKNVYSNNFTLKIRRSFIVWTCHITRLYRKWKSRELIFLFHDTSSSCSLFRGMEATYTFYIRLMKKEIEANANLLGVFSSMRTHKQSQGAHTSNSNSSPLSHVTYIISFCLNTRVFGMLMA